MDGYRVMPMAQAAKIGDIFITVTGDIHVTVISEHESSALSLDRNHAGAGAH